VSESGSGSLAWHFSVNNADIQFLAQDQSVSQIYTVFVTDNHGGSTAQQVTVTINGTNDAPSRRRFAAVRSGCL
jgi:VCBS repeat-containing protein